MKFKIIGDSCTDLTKEDLEKGYYVAVPLSIEVDGYEIVDDEGFDQKDFLKRMADYAGCPKSACPSPEMYMEAFSDAEEIYVITLSSHLSGSYNSAELARKLYQEEHPQVKIHVLDSQSASSGQYLLAHQIEEWALTGHSFEEIVKDITEVRDNMNTLFVLESLETLRKNGRLTGIKSVVAGALDIKPYMKGEKGVIRQVGQARGMKKALAKMIDYAGKASAAFSDKQVVIAHCNCYERAKEVEAELLSRYAFRGSVILDTKGISSLYANDGGIIIAF